MKKELRVSDSLALPLAYATSRNMVLAQSGAGKSNVCVVLAEEMHRVGIPWVAIDRKGDWYGVRSNRSGKQRGLDVPVFGGEFGDMPLSPLAGARMAELVAAGKFAGVLDVSDFPKDSDVSKFLIDFANTLLKKQRTPVHLFLEECQDYLPQGGYRGQVDPLAAACVGAMKRLATKGRFRGIGYTLISQRAAEVNKTALYQCETLIALRLVGDLDIKWIEGWVKRSSKRAPELLETIHDLVNGEGWVWSPGKLKIIERVMFRQRETFDSGAEPEIGKARVVPKMAPVEMDALRRELADLEEQAKADDPKLLRQQVAALTKELASERAKKPVAMATPKPVGRVLATHEVAIHVNHLKEIVESTELLGRALDASDKTISDLRRAVTIADRIVRRARDTGTGALSKELAKAPPVPKKAPKEKANRLPDGPSLSPKSKIVIIAPDTGLPAGERAVMIAIAQHPNGVTREQISILTGYKQSTRNAYVQRLSTYGYVEAGRDMVEATDLGRDALGSDYEPLPTGRDLFEYWLKELPDGERKVLEAVAESGAITREEIGKQTGYKTSTRNAYIQRLGVRRLVNAGREKVEIAEELVG